MAWLTSRYVAATNAEEAELAAVQLIRADSTFGDLLNDPDDDPMIFAEEIVELEPNPDGIDSYGNSGYSFYEDDQPLP